MKTRPSTFTIDPATMSPAAFALIDAAMRPESLSEERSGIDLDAAAARIMLGGGSIETRDEALRALNGAALAPKVAS